MNLKQKIARKWSNNMGRAAKKQARMEKGVIGAPPLPKVLKLISHK